MVAASAAAAEMTKEQEGQQEGLRRVMSRAYGFFNFYIYSGQLHTPPIPIPSASSATAPAPVVAAAGGARD